MRDLLDRFGCVIQVGVGVGMFLALTRWTGLPWWGAAMAAIVGSYVGTWALMAVAGLLFDGRA